MPLVDERRCSARNEDKNPHDREHRAANRSACQHFAFEKQGAEQHREERIKRCEGRHDGNATGVQGVIQEEHSSAIQNAGRHEPGYRGTTKPSRLAFS
jgi:hypothetical protein